MAYPFNLNTWETEAGRPLWVQDQPSIHIKFQAIQELYIIKPYLKTKDHNFQGWDSLDTLWLLLLLVKWSVCGILLMKLDKNTFSLILSGKSSTQLADSVLPSIILHRGGQQPEHAKCQHCWLLADCFLFCRLELCKIDISEWHSPDWCGTCT